MKYYKDIEEIQSVLEARIQAEQRDFAANQEWLGRLDWPGVSAVCAERHVLDGSMLEATGVRITRTVATNTEASPAPGMLVAIGDRNKFAIGVLGERLVFDSVLGGTFFGPWNFSEYVPDISP